MSYYTGPFGKMSAGKVHPAGAKVYLAGAEVYPLERRGIPAGAKVYSAGAKVHQPGIHASVTYFT
jgi:hypothetical protein